VTELFGSIQPLDILDVLVVAYLIYWVLLVLKGTRAVRVLIGILLLVGLYALSSLLDLFTVHWILEEVSIYLVLAMIVLFQEDIRRGLARVAKPLVSTGSRRDSLYVYQEIIQASFRLADQGRGAIIAVEREASLEGLCDHAHRVDAEVSEELLVAIFQSTSPIHDGAVIVQKNRIAAAGSFLPLSTRHDLRPGLGTRHRAALGESEETDCMIFVVSEERREVSMAFRGVLHPVATPDDLRLQVQLMLSMEEEGRAEGDTDSLRSIREAASPPPEDDS